MITTIVDSHHCLLFFLLETNFQLFITLRMNAWMFLGLRLNGDMLCVSELARYDLPTTFISPPQLLRAITTLSDVHLHANKMDSPTLLLGLGDEGMATKHRAWLF